MSFILFLSSLNEVFYDAPLRTADLNINTNTCGKLNGGVGGGAIVLGQLGGGLHSLGAILVHTVFAWNNVKDLLLQLIPLSAETQICSLFGFQPLSSHCFWSVGSIPTAPPHAKLQKLFPACSLRQAACNLPAPCEITQPK